MTIPGTSMEGQDDPDPIDIDPAQAAVADAAAQEHEDDDDTLIETVTVGQQKMVPVSEMIKYRKESKATKRELAELRTRAERAEQVGQQLQDAMPAIEALRNLTPQQRELLASGRLPSPEGTRQPAEDTEAAQWADMQGFIAADGSLDVKRARQNLDWLDERHQRRTEAELAPMRQNTAQREAGVLRERAKAVAHPKTGSPLASPESIDEAYRMLPAELASQPNVAMIAIGTAMVIDAFRGRSPRIAATADPGYAAPIYSEAGGRRGAPAISAEERASLTKLGLSEKELQGASTALSNAAGSRRGIALE